MNDRADNSFPPWPPEGDPPPPPGATEPARRSRWPRIGAALAWVFILAFVSWQVVGRHLSAEAPQVAARDEQLALVVMRMQARYIVGAQVTFHPPGMYDQAKALNTGPVEQRLRFVVLAGELAGPFEARKQLRALDEALTRNRRPYTAAEAATRDRLGKLYGDYGRLRFAAPSLTDADRRQLRGALDWFGDLALAPDGRRFTEQIVLPPAGGPAAAVLEQQALPDPVAREEVLALARRTLMTFLTVFGGACFLGVAGLAGLVVFLVLVARGQVRSRVECGLPYGGVYAETFAVWLALFLGTSLAGALLPRAAPRLLLGGAAMLLSLAALAWPVLRGVPWRQVREDLGLTAGRGPVVEPLCGLVCYGISLPLLAVGVLLTFLLILLAKALTGGGSGFDPLGGPSHPIILDVANGDFWARLEVLVLACVVAPVVEETMFRGVLYRHVRELTCRLGKGWSCFLSATAVSFLFAAIHPQGLVAVPALMALAYGFCIAREWRGTLLPAMVAHGLNNGVVMVVVMLAFGD